MLWNCVFGNVKRISVNVTRKPASLLIILYFSFNIYTKLNHIMTITNLRALS